MARPPVSRPGAERWARATLPGVNSPAAADPPVLVGPADAVVVGVDPGRRVGLAWVDAAGRLLRGAVVDRAALARLVPIAGTVVALGDGTGAGDAEAALAAWGASVVRVDERGSSEEGRALYWRVRPPRGWRRWVPPGMRPPPDDLDAYAAYAIALRWLAARDTPPPRDR